MGSEILLLSAPIFFSGAWFFWRAHLIWNRKRLDLIRIGTKPLTGAHLLQGCFSLVPLLHGLLSVLMALMMIITTSMTPWLLFYLAASVLVVAWHFHLVRALEIYASRGESAA